MISTLLIFLLSSSTLQLTLGRCAAPSLPTSFNPDDIAGKKWYAIRRTKNSKFLIFADRWDETDCALAKFTKDGSKYTVDNYQKTLPNGPSKTTSGTLTFSSGAQGTLTGSSLLPSGDFRVLDANIGFLIVYSCKQFLFAFKREQVYIFSATSNETLNIGVAALAQAALLINIPLLAFSSLESPKQGTSCQYPN